MELIQELKSLRKGRGLLAGRIEERVGPTLRSACAVVDGDGLTAIRNKVTARLVELAEQLPDDLRLAALAAFAIYADADQPLYKDRLRWTATRVDREPRTVRRRVDEAIMMLADLASAGDESGERTAGWHTRDLNVAVVLGGPRPEVFERHRVTAGQDGLRELDLSTSVPPDEATLFHGGTLTTTRHGGVRLALPKPLSQGESHEFAMLFRPRRLSGQLTYVPSRMCERFDLRIRFGEAPEAVFKLDGVFQEELAGRRRRGERCQPNPTDEVHLRFGMLTPGLAYGACWDWS
ncbi:hypothetical protein [Amycolatopsis regifaucium]|uniref:hypothetical protein n=1 Tax=Amycolatopsis regifaucium TaxID=546365 RepID=UPI001160DDED|nr:hypothetical protein [Amycolatopsis regifaucium]